MKGNIVISDNKKMHSISCNDILRLESQDGYTIVHCKNNQQYVSTNHLKLITKDLDPKLFLRVHKSHVVNLKEVKTFEKGKGGLLTMSDGSIVVVSRRNKSGFLKKFCSE